MTPPTRHGSPPASLRAALPSFVQHRPLLLDTGVIVFLLAVGGGRLVHEGTGSMLTWTLTVALVAPLWFRRRAPEAVFAAITAAALVQWVTAPPLAADAALLVALYTIAAQRPQRAAIVAAAIVEVGAALAAARWEGGDAGPISHFVLLSGMTTSAVVLGVNIRTRRAYLAALEDRAARLEAERDSRAQLAAASERARIAREMHDIVTHNLAVMIALADGARFVVDSEPIEARAAMRQVSATGRNAIAEMRRVLGVLRADPETGLQPQPGLNDLDGLIDQVRAAGLVTHLTVTGTPFPLGPGPQLCAYRVVQEALTNVLKHATDATSAAVTLEYCDNEHVVVEIVDDGRAERAADVSRGHGVTGMQERAELYGGTAQTGPRPGGGWAVRVTFDLATAPA